MPERKDSVTGTESGRTDDGAGRLCRRRLLQVAGAGVATATLGTGVASAAGEDRPHVIVFDGRGSSRSVPYRVGVSGSIAPHGSFNSIDRHDAIDGDTASGFVGGGRDAYRFDGNLTHLRAGDGVEVTIRYGDMAEAEADRLEVVTPADGHVEYTFGCDAAVEKVLFNEDNSAEEENDDVTRHDDGSCTVTGLTGNGYGDTFDLYGDLTSFEPATGEFTLFLNGQEVTVADLTGQQPHDGAGDGGGGATGGTAVGGGSGYANTVTRGEADAVVRSVGDLSSALSSASAGAVVFVAGDAELALGSRGLDVPAGVTLASNRGVDGAPGALIATNREPTELFSLHRNARLAGLRIRGPHPGGDSGGSSSARAVSVRGGGVEIDNCDVWGFAYAGIFVDGGDGRIHHNVLRECNKGGLGYGISMVSGNPTIEYNYFNYNRHSVATDGSHHGYVCRYNHFGPDLTSHVIDMHDPAGVRYEVHNNVVEGYVDTGGSRRPAVAVRGVPDDVALIEDNWFWNPEPPGSSPSYTWTDEAIIQPETGSSWASVSFSGNHYGEDAGVSFGDVIPGYDGGRS